MRFADTDIPGIADEYVLGLLDTADAREVEAEMERNGALASAVVASRERFLPLDMQVEPAELKPGLWDRIEAGLPEAAAVPIGSPISGAPAPANDNRRWRMTALAGMAASLVLAIGLTWSLTRTVEPLVIAVLLNETGEVQAVVEDFGNETASVRLLNDFSVPADKTIQAWTLPSREMGPVSARPRPRIAIDPAQGACPPRAEGNPALRDHAGTGRRLADRTADRADSCQGICKDHALTTPFG